MNYGLIAAILMVFVGMVLMRDATQAWVAAFAFVPTELDRALYQGEGLAAVAALGTGATSIFLHASWPHVIGNLIYLRVFGDNVEDHFGRAAYLVFFLSAGVLGIAMHYVFYPTSSTPVVGASGAVAGVLGAYVTLFPRVKVVTLFPIFVFLTFIDVPAFAFVGAWAGQQFLNGYFVLEGSPTMGDNIAWFVHIGGFLAGVAGGFWVRFGRLRRRWLRAP